MGSRLRTYWGGFRGNGGGVDARSRMKKTSESVRTTIPTGQRKKPAAVESNVVPMLSARAFGSAMPELPSVPKARVIPNIEPSKPKTGDSVSSEPTTMPVISNLRFAFILSSIAVESFVFRSQETREDVKNEPRGEWRASRAVRGVKVPSLALSPH